MSPPSKPFLIDKRQVYEAYLEETFLRLVRRSPMPPLQLSFDLNKQGPRHPDKKALNIEELRSIL